MRSMVFVRDVDVVSGRARSYFGGGLAGKVGVEVAERDAGALGGEGLGGGLGGGEADPAGGAGDRDRRAAQVDGGVAHAEISGEPCQWSAMLRALGIPATERHDGIAYRLPGSTKKAYRRPTVRRTTAEARTT